jgi:hypothetical protein
VTATNFLYYRDMENADIVDALEDVKRAVEQTDAALGRIEALLERLFWTCSWKKHDTGETACGQENHISRGSCWSCGVSR